MVFRIQPFATDKSKFGEEYNAHCEAAPDGSWIQLTDWDTMPLSLEAFALMDKAIARYPDTAIFGAMTNRVGLHYQRLNQGQPEQIDSMQYHITRAKELATLYPNGECERAVSPYIAGFFMLFKKEYWQDNKFQPRITDRNGVLFDYNFCKKAIKKRLPVRIIKGLYVWHTYRLDKADWRDKSHLQG